jgi:hypothetical protein
LSALALDHILRLLEEYVCQSGQRLDVLLIGRLALYAYGSQEARTDDVDAELAQDVEEVGAFLKQHGVPSNLSGAPRLYSREAPLSSLESSHREADSGTISVITR